MGESEFDILLEYCRDVLSWWYALIPGLVLSLVDVVERHRGKDSPIATGWLIRTFVAGLILAQFLAYRDIRKQVVSSRPDFEITTNQLLASYSPGSDETLVLLSLSILNKGADSSVKSYQAHYRSSTLDKDVRIVHLTDDVLVRMFPDSPDLIKNGVSQITDRTYSPIVRGQIIVGRLPVVLSGDRRAEINRGDTVFSITAFDYLGLPHTGTFTGGQRGLPPTYVP